jgi:hypothetical protein
MTSHKFAVGQTFEFLPSSRDGGIPRGRYKVQRLLPAERRECQYRVQHTVDGHERVVLEGQLIVIGGVFD